MRSPSAPSSTHFSSGLTDPARDGSVTKTREAPGRHRTFISDVHVAVPLAINHYEIFAPRYRLFNYSKKPGRAVTNALTLFNTRTGCLVLYNIFCKIKDEENRLVLYFIPPIKNIFDTAEKVLRNKYRILPSYYSNYIPSIKLSRSHERCIETIPPLSLLIISRLP